MDKVKPRGAWTEELGVAFLALLRDTGNARASARALGHRHLFNNRMRRNPAFRRACDDAAAAADARLRTAASPFPPPLETKSMPGEPKPERPRQVIRRTSNGRTQISHVREGCWTAEIEEAFLARLRATGNLERSARAVGFHPGTVYRRLREWPAFAEACRAALDDASVMLDYRLVAHAHSLLRLPGEPREEDEEEDDTPFDPVMAMRILSFIDRRRSGATNRGRRRGPPEKTFAESVRNILSKIEAIERHRKMQAERGEGGGRATD